MPSISKSALLEVPVEVAYNVVIDVEQYPQFLPACRDVQISSSAETGLTAAVTVGGSVGGRAIEETFVTRNQHRPHTGVFMALEEGPFERLEGQWTFKALGDIGCRVDVLIHYEPRGLLARMLAGLIEPMANRMVDAFTQRIQTVARQRN